MQEYQIDYKWDDFSCAILGRARQMRTKQVFLIPNICTELPADPAGKHRFLTQHYQKLIHFHGTGNNIRAIGTSAKLIRRLPTNTQDDLCCVNPICIFGITNHKTGHPTQQKIIRGAAKP